MKKVFLIYKNYSDYESCPEVIGFKHTSLEAEDIVSKLKAEYKKAYDFMWEVIYPAQKAYDAAHETPHQVLEDIPRWPAGIAEKDITVEMRSERNEIKAKNEEKRKFNMAAMEEHQKVKLVALMPLFDSLEKEFVEKWFDFSRDYITCRARGLKDNYEYSFEECNEI